MQNLKSLTLVINQNTNFASKINQISKIWYENSFNHREQPRLPPEGAMLDARHQKPHEVAKRGAPQQEFAREPIGIPQDLKNIFFDKIIFRKFETNFAKFENNNQDLVICDGLFLILGRGLLQDLKNQ